MEHIHNEKLVHVRKQISHHPAQGGDPEPDLEAWSTELDVKRLGWQRPAEFASTWMEVSFVVSSIGALSMADFIVDGFQVLLPTLIEPFNIPPGSQIWPSSVVTMIAGSFLFPLGRLTDMYGGYYIFNGGLFWFTFWTLAAGFATDFVFLVFCRAMQGLGLAAFLPAGIALLGRFYRPGPRKNLVFALYGASCPLGLFGGMLTAGLAEQVFSQWRCFFWVGGVFTGLCCVGTILTSPRDLPPGPGVVASNPEKHKSKVSMDWPGTLTTVPGFMLVLYAAAKGTNSDNGFAAPHVVVAFLLGIIFLGVAVYVEAKVESPLIPVEIFRVKHMKAMLLYLVLSWGVYCIYLFYTNFYIQTVLQKSSLTTALWYAPWAAAGLLLSTLGGIIMDRIPGSWLLVPSSVSAIMAILLFALMPAEANYWLWVFPAMIFEAVSADLLWTVSNVFLTTSLPRHHQGLAGAIISLTLFMADALFLAVGDVVEERLSEAGADASMQYKGVFWTGVVIGLAAIFVNCFIRIPEAAAELTSEERNDLDRASWRRDSGGSVTDSDTVVASETEGLLEEPSV
ncbi:hypothetical protein XA68_17805 [Ophiocordyceps unilateralis]|uniref:Major facilitator superfamily (MFS) profile domain-containing protein n=1 Tax=Ophiocordyceps unilateralis TaxID=268505 RepID=A0A2A9P475_OPHUN|nr:hypothetical protein XA68_17805 [Ophiocordyceps unilateralis]